MYLDLAVSLDSPPGFIFPGTVARYRELDFTQHTAPTIHLRFYREGVLVGLPSGFALALTLRRADQFDPSENLASTSSWTEVQYGSGYSGDTYYEGILNLGDAAMTAWFAEERRSYRTAKGYLLIDGPGIQTNSVSFIATVRFGQPA